MKFIKQHWQILLLIAWNTFFAGFYLTFETLLGYIAAVVHGVLLLLSCLALDTRMKFERERGKTIEEFLDELERRRKHRDEVFWHDHKKEEE